MAEISYSDVNPPNNKLITKKDHEYNRVPRLVCILLSDVFFLADEDEDGYLDYDELKKALDAIGHRLKSNDLSDLLDEFSHQRKVILTIGHTRILQKVMLYTK